MGQTFQTKEIDGQAFTVRQLPAMKGLRMLNRLARHLGPAVAAAAAGARGGLEASEAQKLVGGISKVFESLSDDELESITRSLLETATINVEGKDSLLMPQFDLLMQGRIDAVLKLLVFAFEVNYGNFFSALSALGRQHLSASKSNSAGSTTSAKSGLAGD